MITGIKHLHTLLVFLFVITYVVKAILMITNQSEVLAKYRKKTMVPEMIIATLFVVTGLYMLFTLGMGNLGGWFHIKLTLIILAIPMGFIGYKRDNKPMAIGASLLFLYILALAWTKSLTLFF